MPPKEKKPRSKVVSRGSQKTTYAGATLRDDADDKVIPASLASLIAVIRQFWPSHEGSLPPGREATLQWYAENMPSQLAGALTYTKKKYRGIRAESAVMQGIQLLERGNNQAKYWQLRLISEWVGLSVAELIMFTHFVSIERRCHNGEGDRTQRLSELVEEYERVVKVFKEIVEKGIKTTDDIFYESIPGQHKYRPRLDVLARVIKAADRQLHSVDPKNEGPQQS